MNDKKLCCLVNPVSPYSQSAWLRMCETCALEGLEDKLELERKTIFDLFDATSRQMVDMTPRERMRHMNPIPTISFFICVLVTIFYIIPDLLSR